jgi:hypothetical protein
MNMPSERARAYFYRCLLGGQPLIVAYGIETSTRTALWVSFAAAVLGLGLASANTTTKG